MILYLFPWAPQPHVEGLGQAFQLSVVFLSIAWLFSQPELGPLLATLLQSVLPLPELLCLFSSLLLPGLLPPSSVDSS